MADGLTFGAIGVTGNSTAEATTDATPRKIAAFDTDGESNRMTNAAATDKITVVEAGTYFVNAHICFSGTLSKTFEVQVYKNTTATGIPLTRKLGAGGDVGSAGCCALATFGVGDEISLYHSSTDGGTAFTAVEASLFVQRVV